MDNLLRDFIEDMEDEGLSVPTKYEVCPSCQGRGSSSAHLGTFFPGDEWLSDPDFREDYAAGAYDRACDGCDGLRVVTAIDELLASKDILARWERYVTAEYDLRAMEAAERRMGC